MGFYVKSMLLMNLKSQNWFHEKSEWEKNSKLAALFMYNQQSIKTWSVLPISHMEECFWHYKEDFSVDGLVKGLFNVPTVSVFLS